MVNDFSKRNYSHHALNRASYHARLYQYFSWNPIILQARRDILQWVLFPIRSCSGDIVIRESTGSVLSLNILIISFDSASAGPSGPFFFLAPRSMGAKDYTLRMKVRGDYLCRHGGLSEERNQIFVHFLTLNKIYKAESKFYFVSSNWELIVMKGLCYGEKKSRK